MTMLEKVFAIVVGNTTIYFLLLLLSKEKKTTQVINRTNDISQRIPTVNAKNQEIRK